MFLGTLFGSLPAPDLLILDDFGLKPIQPPRPEALYDVINEYYERSSNCASIEWPALLLDPLLASSGFDYGAGVLIRGINYRVQGRSRLMEEVPIAPK